jgi:NAD(P)-dependent dehydrogenase (short-subunit alcohol dehydrogenase family)
MTDVGMDGVAAASESSEIDRGRLAGKVALVSGGGSRPGGVGIGEAIAALFAGHGARVIVGDIDGPAGQRTVDAIAAAGGVGAAIRADVTRAADAERLVDACLSRFDALDILVNNVGVTGPSASVVDVSESDWDAVLATNVKSMMLVCKHAIPVMPSGGSIVNMGSIGALRWTERTAYATSKGAVLALTVSLAGQHAAQGIRVNSVIPGAVWTPLVAAEVEARARDARDLARIRAQRVQQGILGREGNAWDVAYAALYLASDEARWVTGQSIVVDGGATISRRIDRAND